jgi:hypothetical protein
VLLLVFSLAGTEFGQILRLPVLVEHYLEHRKEHQSLGIGEFLLIHYSRQHTQGANEQDRQLPFKTHHECAKLFSFAAPLHCEVAFHNPPLQEKNRCAPVEPGRLSTGYRTMIWQPPRTA